MEGWRLIFLSIILFILDKKGTFLSSTQVLLDFYDGHIFTI